MVDTMSHQAGEYSNAFQSRMYPADLTKRLPATTPPARSSEPARSSGLSSSLFTIDSILAPRPNSSASQHSLASAPHRVANPALLRHPLHFGHLAAAASGFGGTSSDFLGQFCVYILLSHKKKSFLVCLSPVQCFTIQTC